MLAPGGVVRIAVPSLEQIRRCNNEAYFKFTQRWQKRGPTARGAMDAIIHAHGHEAAWNATLLEDSLFFAGFENLKLCKPGESEHPELKGAEGHEKVIGKVFNDIETIVCEGTKPGTHRPVRIATITL